MDIKHKDLAIELVNVICTLWIVGVWHLSSYGNVFNIESWGPWGNITLGMMGTFMFFSGYFLQKYQISNGKDLINFYYKRIERFYILFFLSTFLLHIGTVHSDTPWFTGKFQLISTLCGFASFINPPVLTLWFMSMLMLFYLVTPVVLLAKENRHRIFLALALSILFLSIGIIISGTDHRLFVLFPLYLTGLCFPYDKFEEFSDNIWGLIICVMLLIMSTSRIKLGYVPQGIMSAISVTIILTYFCRHLTSNQFYAMYIAKYVSYLSYISLTVYLFHREIYIILNSLFLRMGIGLTVWSLYLIFLPTALIISYWIQKTYDAAIRRIKNIIANQNQRNE